MVFRVLLVATVQQVAMAQRQEVILIREDF
jgi:hypothetical protein